jgi:predicted lipid-binding transport protein (Tim44 family)
MKKILLTLFIGALSLGFAASPVEAKRLGGGLSQGMKRQAPAQRPAQPTPQQPPAQQQPPANNAATAPTSTGTAAPAPAPRRSWMGPIAGLAAGLGLAALASHFGFGEGLANIMMIALLVFAAVFLVRFLIRRFAAPGADAQGMRYAGAGATPAGSAPGWRDEPALPRDSPTAGGSALAASTALAAPALPAGVDAAAFERAAKMIFIRMQAANDAGDLDDLRQFSTPEMFAAFRLDLQDRRGAPQRTDVVRLNAELVDAAEEAGQQIVSVRFHGLVREEQDGGAAPFDEVWHLVRPNNGSRDWAIAGIAQQAGAVQ